MKIYFSRSKGEYMIQPASEITRLACELLVEKQHGDSAYISHTDFSSLVESLDKKDDIFLLLKRNGLLRLDDFTLTKHGYEYDNTIYRAETLEEIIDTYLTNHGLEKNLPSCDYKDGLKRYLMEDEAERQERGIYKLEDGGYVWLA